MPSLSYISKKQG